MLGGLGVLDQGADSTLRDPEVQVLLLLLLFFPSHIGTGFSDKSVFATFCLGGAFTLPQGRKEVPNIIFSLYAKCMVCRNGIHTHTHTPSLKRKHQFHSALRSIQVSLFCFETNTFAVVELLMMEAFIEKAYLCTALL